MAFRQLFHSLSSCAAGGGAAECRMPHFESQMHGWSLRASEVFVYMEAGRRFAQGQPYGRQVHKGLSVVHITSGASLPSLSVTHHAQKRYDGSYLGEMDGDGWRHGYGVVDRCAAALAAKSVVFLPTARCSFARAATWSFSNARACLNHLTC